MRRQRRRIHQPGVGHGLAQTLEKFFPQFPPPKIVQIAIPQQGEQHFFLKHRLGWRREPDGFRGGQFQNARCVRHVGEIKQFEETIDGVAGGEVGKPPVLHGEPVPELGREPLHLRPIGGRFFGNDNAHARRGTENAGEPVQHSSFAAEDFSFRRGVGGFGVG